MKILIKIAHFILDINLSFSKVTFLVSFSNVCSPAIGEEERNGLR